MEKIVKAESRFSQPLTRMDYSLSLKRLEVSSDMGLLRSVSSWISSSVAEMPVFKAAQPYHRRKAPTMYFHQPKSARPITKPTAMATTPVMIGTCRLLAIFSQVLLRRAVFERMASRGSARGQASSIPWAIFPSFLPLQEAVFLEHRASAS